MDTTLGWLFVRPFPFPFPFPFPVFILPTSLPPAPLALPTFPFQPCYLLLLNPLPLTALCAHFYFLSHTSGIVGFQVAFRDKVVTPSH